MAVIRVNQAIVVEGRDDVNAVKSACDALIIATHGFGISAETWKEIDKAHSEKGIIILTDPDHAGEEIRRRINEKYPDAVNAFIDRGDAESGGDIGVENASPDVIKDAIEKALELSGRKESEGGEEKTFADMRDLAELGLSGCEGASERRAAVCKALGIGYGNASAMITKLRGFGIDIDELREAVRKIQ